MDSQSIFSLSRKHHNSKKKKKDSFIRKCEILNAAVGSIEPIKEETISACTGRETFNSQEPQMAIPNTH
jgi:hypothetical protein